MIPAEKSRNYFPLCVKEQKEINVLKNRVIVVYNLLETLNFILHNFDSLFKNEQNAYHLRSYRRQ